MHTLRALRRRKLTVLALRLGMVVMVMVVVVLVVVGVRTILRGVDSVRADVGRLAVRRGNVLVLLTLRQLRSLLVRTGEERLEVAVKARRQTSAPTESADSGDYQLTPEPRAHRRTRVRKGRRRIRARRGGRHQAPDGSPGSGCGKS